jgi:hypothetical protein
MRSAILILTCSLVLSGNVFAQQAKALTPSDYNFLVGMGQWIEAKRFGGQVWKPNVNSDWRPFRYGEWIPSDKGWLWHSYEPFGWALYHYGNWYNDLGVGWYWIPGYEWSPARVQWKTSQSYIAWAPLPPKGYEVEQPGKSKTATIWNVVELGDFTRPDIGQILVRQVPDELEKSLTTNAPNIAMIEKASGKKLQTVTLKTSQRGPMQDVDLPPDIRDRATREQKKLQYPSSQSNKPQSQPQM